MGAGGNGVLAAEMVGLHKRFVAVRGLRPGRPKSTVDALRGVDLRVPHGTIHGVIGPNGSGKSTLLRVLATLILPDAGTASVDGRDVTKDARAVRGSIGFSTGEERSHYWRITARQNLEFAAALFHLPDRDRAITAALEQVHLGDEADRPVSGFSQGMARRLGLARALLHEPAVLLLDEPARSLDPSARADFHAALIRLREERGTSVVLTTHDLGEAVEVCDEVSVLNAGRVADVMTPTSERDLETALQRAAQDDAAT